MKKLWNKLHSHRGLTLVEMVIAAGVLSLLGLMLHTGLSMAQDSYYKMSEEAESQLLLSTLSDLISNELRYARDVKTEDNGMLQYYTSVNYGINTSLSLDEEGQLKANGRRMLSSGAYGNGAYRIDASTWHIAYDKDGVFQVTLKVTGRHSVSNEISFSVRCLNRADDEGGNT